MRLLAVFLLGVWLCFTCPVFSQLSECRIDFNTAGDGADVYGGNTWNLKTYAVSTGLALTNIDGSSAVGATVRLENLDDKLPNGCWSLGSVDWIHSASGEGADQLFYTSAADIQSFIRLENLVDGYYRIDLVVSYSYTGTYYSSDYQIGSNYGVVREPGGDIVSGMTGQGFNPNAGYNDGRYISWSDIVPDDGSISVQISGSNHNMINALRIIYTGDLSLPVDLSMMRAQWKGNSLLIEWCTASEQDNLGFEIHRSCSEVGGFERIASYLDRSELMSKGNSTTISQYSYTDLDANFDDYYWYKIVDVDIAGNRTEHGPFKVQTEGEQAKHLDQFEIYPCYPNPFNPVTRIDFELPGDQYTQITIFNVLGKPVCELVNSQLSAGRHSVTWDAKDSNGNEIAGGVYFVHVSSGSFSEVTKIIYLK